ncbi:MAG: hypothetical protein EAZ47_03730 [Bacteroidetes bacterium]|nr:MAG: hypothetical protein EAY72_06910 [Bacteroidota bacterium]TAF94838.1 MAG: hypothetical protein EAZ47_03730 [Bacteroidota bacterium]
MIKAKLFYKILVVLNNLLACFFLGLFFLGASNNNGEGAPMITEQQALFKQAIYGIVVSLFFSAITFLLGVIFRKKMSSDWKYLTRAFLLQFFTLIIVYVVIGLFMYLK